jgi:hypothetical protein
MVNVVLDKGPRELAECDVWPKSRAHLLGEGYNYELVSAVVKSNMVVSEALLRFHYPTLYEDPRVLFCDTGNHIVIYIAKWLGNLPNPVDNLART